MQIGKLDLAVYSTYLRSFFFLADQDTFSSSLYPPSSFQYVRPTLPLLFTPTLFHSLCPLPHSCKQ
jgi:hypothetical protein